ncbi:MAG: DUF4337 domain-containing protein [Alphaproteobacteria bacterium]|nr:DUF4337 domain-containing protein [Alphaproteobacteria bacterium]
MSAHAHIEGSNKRIAIMIAALAALLALSESAGKSAQTAALGHHIEASNLWAFFQAKTIRQTTLRTAAETLEADAAEGLSAAKAEAFKKRIDAWRATAQRYESEPETNEGRRELMARARNTESLRDKALAAYHQFEFGSAAFQIGIVLASASVITGAIWLALSAGVLGVIGMAFTALGLFAPTLIHL